MLRIRDVYPGSEFLASRILNFFIPDPKYASKNLSILTSVGDPGCLSRIPDPYFYPSRIQKQQQKRGVKKMLCHMVPFCVNFTKLKIILCLRVKKKIWSNFQRIIELFMQKVVTKLSKIWFWDPGSGKNLFRIPDPQHCYQHKLSITVTCKKYRTGTFLTYRTSSLFSFSSVLRIWIRNQVPF